MGIGISMMILSIYLTYRFDVTLQSNDEKSTITRLFLTYLSIPVGITLMMIILIKVLRHLY